MIYKSGHEAYYERGRISLKDKISNLVTEVSWFTGNYVSAEARPPRRRVIPLINNQ